MEIKFLGKNGLSHLITKIQTLLDNKVDKVDGKQLSLDNVYPVGSIYITVSTADPSGLFGGTWEYFGAGCTLVSVDASQTEFSSVEKTGGEKTHTLSTSEMPSHTHTFTGSSATTSTDGAHTHKIGTDKDVAYTSGGACWSVHSESTGAGYTNGATNSSGDHTHTVTAKGSNSNTGGGSAHNNLQPYVTVYMWKRTA